MNEPNEPDPGIPYLQEERESFSAALNKIQWTENKDLGGISLIAACPTCGHVDAINVFLPINNTLPWAAEDADRPAQFIECECDAEHADRPTAVKNGCGRWGMVTPQIPGQSR